MKFNKSKSVIMIHRKANRYSNDTEIEGIKKVDEAKVLGFQFNRQANSSAHIEKTKAKIGKVSRMLFLAGKSEIYKWKRLYIFM